MTFSKEDMEDYLGFLEQEQKELESCARALFKDAQQYAPPESRKKVENIASVVASTYVALTTLIAEERAKFFALDEQKTGEAA